MRTELTAKFLHHLNTRKHGETGFTLVELLVVIIIIGILAAIALPNFLNQSAKAKQTEARQNIGNFNRLQNAFRGDQTNIAFASNFDVLAMGTLAGATTTANTVNYSYTMSAGTQNTTLQASANDATLKSYGGGVNQYANSANNVVSQSIVCERTAPGAGAVAIITNAATPASCPAGSSQLGP